MYTFCKKYGNKILLRDHLGEVKTITKHKWEYYHPDPDGKYKSIDGATLSKKTRPSIKKAMAGIEEDEHYMKLFGAKNFGYQYIRDVYKNCDPIYPKDLYIANIDIETGRDELGYSPPEDARCPVTSITLQDIFADEYTVWGYKEEGYFPKTTNVRYINCRDEHELLVKFVMFISRRYPDIITGWNVEQYDIPYLVNRIYNIIDSQGEVGKFIDTLSPFGFVNDRQVHDAFGNNKQVYDIMGISTLDYLPLFKKFTYKTPENYKLDTVAHMILGRKKIDYSEYANLQDLYDNDYEKFIDYNIEDVNLVTQLNNKLRLFDTIFSVAYKAGVNYTDVVSPVTTWDVLIYNAVMDKGIIPPLNIPDSQSSPYVGAFVKEPKPGMYNWIMSVDLNSLYPHIQMGTNISPEKRIKQKDLHPDLLAIQTSLQTTIQGIYRLVEREIDTSALVKHNVALAPNGQFYKRDADGFIPVILEGLYNERKAVKRSMLDDKQKMEDNPKLELSDQIAAKDSHQMALKILMNSEYGALANSYFRYFELRNAEAITSTGQMAIMWVAKYLNIWLNRILKTDNADYVVAIDTDSVYLNLEHLVKTFIKTDDTDRIVDILSGWGTEILEPEIDRIYKDLAQYVNAHKQKMIMGREVIADKAFWTGKKRYALNVYDNEGVRYAKPKTKIMGLECVRSSVPEFCRNFIKDGIIKILTEDERAVQDFILEVRENFFSQPPEEISFPRGTNNIEKYTDERGYPKKGCPIHVRGCIVYNKFLDDWNLTDERIQSGDKVKFCHLRRPNIFQSHVIAYPPAMNPKVYEELKQYIDYEAQWIGTFFKPVDAIMECVGWSGERVNDLFA